MITLTDAQVEAVYQLRLMQNRNGEQMRQHHAKYQHVYDGPGWRERADEEHRAYETLNADMEARSAPVIAALKEAGIDIWHDPDVWARDLDEAEIKGYMTAEDIAEFRAQIAADAPNYAAQRARMEAQAKA